MFDEKKAELAIRFFERRLTHTKGKFARKPFTLPPWQRKIVGEVFGTVDHKGKRLYTKVYIEVPKKNGKTELAAGFADYLLLVDQEPGAEIYSVASTRDQASLCFRTAAQMVRQNDQLMEMVDIHRSSKTLNLKDDPECFYKAISADADTGDGINPHAAVYDELHRQKTRDLWDVIEFGMDTREQPLLIAITTAGVFGESPICQELHDYARNVINGTFKDPHFYAVIYSLDPEEDWTFEGQPEKRKNGKLIAPATGWYKANPALGDFLPVARIREACERAKKIPSSQSSFRRFRLNQWVNQESIWIPNHEWKACGEPFDAASLVGEECYAGLDLSTNLDVTAFVKVFGKDDNVLVLADFWLPEEDLVERCRRDMVPYDVWAKQGLVHLTPGSVIDYDYIESVIKEQSEIYQISELAYDRWNASAIVTHLMDHGLTMVPIAQSFPALSTPTKELERRIMNRTIRHNNNPVLAWMMDCCSLKQDTKDNVMPVKPDRRKSSKRIDGVLALIMALDRLTRHQPATIYESQDLKVI
jgi:phage terminase large subunit-like protein